MPSSDFLAPSDLVTDIFGEEWRVTRRVDSGHGFDLLYGVAPENTSETAAAHHIVDAALERFILENLDRFGQIDLPITGTRKGKLRRIVSSRRYRDLADWEARRDPAEPVFWVDPDYIDLPPLRDVTGALYHPHEIRFFRPGCHVWTGMPATPNPGRKRVRMGYVLTQPLADLLFAAADQNLAELEALGLPVSLRSAKLLRNWALAHFRPDLHALKADTPLIRRGTARLHRDFVEGAVIADALGRRYRIHTIHETEAGDLLLRGAPEHARHHPGREVILTQEIAALLDVDRAMGSNSRLATRLGVSVNRITRLRNALLQRSPTRSTEKWWAARLGDLLSCTPKAFSERHGCARESATTHRRLVRQLLTSAAGHEPADGFGPNLIAALATDRSTPDIAANFGIATARITGLRQALRWLRLADWLIETAGGLRLSADAKKHLDAQAARHARGLSDNDLWWLEHLRDLEVLTPTEFATRHDRSPLSVRQMRQDLATLRACTRGEDKGAPYIADLQGDAPAPTLARKYSLHGPGPIHNHRKALRILTAAGQI